LSGISSSVPPRRLLALPIDDTVTSIRLPCRANGGSVAVAMTAAMFLSCSELLDGNCTPNCPSILAKVCVVNGVCVV